jgi:hypothetical protein
VHIIDPIFHASTESFPGHIEPLLAVFGSEFVRHVGLKELEELVLSEIES